MANLIVPGASDLAIGMREPALLVQGKQPLGFVEMDWGNSLARGCESFWIIRGQGFNNLTGTRDLVNPQATWSLNTTNEVCTGYPTYVLTSGISSRLADLAWVRGEIAPPYTILVGYDYISGVVPWSFLISTAWTGLYGPSNDSGVLGANAASFQLTLDMRTVAGPRRAEVDFVAAVVRGSNDAAGCSNGGGIVTDTSFTASTYTPARFRLGNDRAGSNPAVAKIACFAFFNRALSDAELQALTANPYQILKPAP